MEIITEMKLYEMSLNSQRTEIKDICAFLDKNKELISDLYIGQEVPLVPFHLC